MCGRARSNIQISVVNREMNMNLSNDNVNNHQKMIDENVGKTLIPGMEIVTLINKEFEKMIWGYTMAHNQLLYNIRFETIMNDRFRNQRKNRCVVCLSEIYEKNKKYECTVYNENNYIYVACLYRISKDGKKKSVTMITVDACSKISKIHNRQPFVLDSSMINEWLYNDKLSTEEMIKMNEKMREIYEMDNDYFKIIYN
jgi:putative SOS response-associated peptidase YedK